MKSLLVLGLILSFYSCDANRKKGSRVLDPNEPTTVEVATPATEDVEGKLACTGGLMTAVQAMKGQKQSLKDSLHEMKNSYELILATEEVDKKSALTTQFLRDEASYVKSVVDLTMYCKNIMDVVVSTELEEGCLIGNEIINHSKIGEICNKEAQYAQSESMRVELDELGLFSTKADKDEENSDVDTPVTTDEDEVVDTNENEVTDDNTVTEADEEDDTQSKIKTNLCTTELKENHSQANMIRDLLNQSIEAIKIDRGNANNQELEIESRIQAKNNVLERWNTAFGSATSVNPENAEGLYKKLVTSCLKLDALIATEHPCRLGEEGSKLVVNASSFQDICQLETSEILFLNNSYKSVSELELKKEEKEDVTEVEVVEDKKEEKKDTEKEEKTAEEIIEESKKKAQEKKDEQANKKKDEKKETSETSDADSTESNDSKEEPKKEVPVFTLATPEDGKCSPHQIGWLTQTHYSAWRIFDFYGKLKTAHDNRKVAKYPQTKEKEIRIFTEIYNTHIVPIKDTAEKVCLQAQQYQSCKGTFKYNRIVKGKSKFNMENSAPTEAAVVNTCNQLKLQIVNINTMLKNNARAQAKIKKNRENKDEDESYRERPTCTPEVDYAVEDVEAKKDELNATLLTIEGDAQVLRDSESSIDIEKNRLTLTSDIKTFDKNIRELEMSCKNFNAETNGMDSCGHAVNILKYTDLGNVRDNTCDDTEADARVQKIKKELKIK